MALKKSLNQTHTHAHTHTRLRDREWEKNHLSYVCVCAFFLSLAQRLVCLSHALLFLTLSFAYAHNPQSTARHDPNHKFVRYENGALVWIWYPLLDIFFRISYYHISFVRSFYSMECEAFKLNSFKMNVHCFLLLFPFLSCSCFQFLFSASVFLSLLFTTQKAAITAKHDRNVCALGCVNMSRRNTLYVR